MDFRFVVTRPADNGVTIICPSRNAIAYMMHGGRWPHATESWLQEQIARHIAEGYAPDVSERFVMAMQRGGLSYDEALRLIGERDARRCGVAVELWQVSDLPTDYRYRDAWRRSLNGGPIWIDEDRATEIDEQQMWKAYDATKT